MRGLGAAEEDVKRAASRLSDAVALSIERGGFYSSIAYHVASRTGLISYDVLWSDRG